MKIISGTAVAVVVGALAVSAAARPASRGDLPVPRASPAIGGLVQQNQVLTVDRGKWRGSRIAYSYRWRRCDVSGAACADIGQATDSIYTPTGLDVGFTLRVTVTATSRDGASTADSAATHVVAAAPAGTPLSTARPTVAGGLKKGLQLTAVLGSWATSNPSEARFEFRWRRCNATGGGCDWITKSTRSPSYVVRGGDVGHALRVLVRIAAPGGTAYALSLPTTPPVAPAPSPQAGVAPSNSSRPTISGTAQQARTLTASSGSWSGSTPISFDYQWRRCDTTGANCSDVGGAKKQTYVLTGGDAGRTMRVRVTATNSAGHTSADSDPTGTVAAADAPVNTSPPVISGTVAGERDADHVQRQLARNSPDPLRLRMATLQPGWGKLLDDPEGDVEHVPTRILGRRLDASRPCHRFQQCRLEPGAVRSYGSGCTRGRPAGQRLTADALGAAVGRPDRSPRRRLLERNDADRLLLRLGALRQRRQQLRDDLRRDRPVVPADHRRPGPPSARIGHGQEQRRLELRPLEGHRPRPGRAADALTACDQRCRQPGRDAAGDDGYLGKRKLDRVLLPMGAL